MCETFNFINQGKGPFFLVQQEKLVESQFLDIYDAKVVFFDYGKNIIYIYYIVYVDI